MGIERSSQESKRNMSEFYSPELSDNFHRLPQSVAQMREHYLRPSVLGFRFLAHWGFEESDPTKPVGSFTFKVEKFRVDCPFQVGSKMWTAMCSLKKGQISHPNEEGSYTLSFPRFEDSYLRRNLEVLNPDQALKKKIQETFTSSQDHYDMKTKVIHVEYLCPDGKEHIVVGMPEHWDSELVLGISVRAHIVK